MELFKTLTGGVRLVLPPPKGFSREPESNDKSQQRCYTEDMLGQPWMLYCVAFLHLTWGILLLIDERAGWATSVNAFTSLNFPTQLEAALLIMVSILCLLGIHRKIKKFSIAEHVLYIFPQQLLLLLSGVGAAVAIATSQFADGVVRPIAFIAADQSVYIWIAIFHGISFLEHFGRGLWGKSQ